MRLSPLPHGAIAPSASDFASSGTTRCGSKSQVAPSPWHSGHAPCGELNENARGDISGTLRPTVHAGELAREQPIAAVERIDDDNVAGQAKRDLDRLSQPPLDTAAHDQPIDDDLDGVIAPAVERDLFFERPRLAVDPRLGEPARPRAPAVPS